MTQRVNAKGKTTRMDSRVFFRANGEMVTQISTPTELFIFNNKEGELKIYNPEQNSVFKSVNYNYGSQNNTFYYFLGEVADMGLSQVGYQVTDTRVEDGVMITTWSPPKNLEADISAVEVVNDGEKNIYMAFMDREGEFFKKIYFYDFEILKGISFPKSITEIGYVEDDSVITKTTFDYFEYDNPSDLGILEMKIPDNATLIK